MLVLAILCLREQDEKYQAKTPFAGSLYRHLDFGFTKDGTFSLTVHSSTVSNLTFGLLTNDQYKTYKKTEPDFCSGSVVAAAHAKYAGSPVTLSGAVPAEGVYHVFYSNCGEQSEFEVKYTYDMANGESRLDSRAMPGLIEQPIAIVVVVLILVLWLINWALHRRTKIYVHYVMTVMFVLAVVARLARYGWLKYEEKYDFHRGMQALMVIFRLFFQISLYFVILLCAKGWCIMRRSVKFVELIVALVSTICYLVFQTILDYASLGNWAILVMLLELAAMIVYARELIVAINRGQLQTYAHLLAMSNAGIDPETTPIWQKKNMFERLQYIIMAYLLLVLARLITLYFASSLLWLDAMMEDIADITVLIALAIIYRLRGGNADGYSLLDEMDNGLMLSDIETSEIPRSFNRGGRKWEDGMTLPYATPVLSNVSQVVLDSPDGVSNIEVKPLELPNLNQSTDEPEVI